jgi:hypothetical protein
MNVVEANITFSYAASRFHDPWHSLREKEPIF